MSPISFAKIKTSEVYYKGMVYPIISRSIHLVEIGDKHLLRLNVFDNKHVEIAEVTKIETFNCNGSVRIYYKVRFGEANSLYQNFHFVDHIYGKIKINLADKEFWEYLKDIRRIKCKKLI